LWFSHTHQSTFQMENHPNTKIYEMIREYGIVSHKKRQEFLSSIIEGLIKGRSVIFSEIADKIDKPIKEESIERRIQDFFQKVSLDFMNLGMLMLSFVHHKKVLLSIDRTEWDFGGTQVNILCAVVSVGKMAVPIYFDMLDNKSGNSNADDRIALFRSLVGIIGKDRIEAVVMDREFIGKKWLSWLVKEKIDFCARVPKSHKITFVDGERCTVDELMEGRNAFCEHNVVVDEVVVNLSVSYAKDGEILYLIGSLKSKYLAAIYRRRWSIEVFFQAMKGRGFNMEDSCLKCLKKYRKLFGIVCLAYTLCWAMGIQHGKLAPVKAKKHGYPQFSVFRRGLNLMRKLYKKQLYLDLMEQVIQLARSRMSNITKTVG
jgi:hypothetical protein